MLPSRRESAGEPAARHWRASARVGAQHAAPLHWPPRIVRRSRPWVGTAAVLLLAARPAPAQAIGQGFELERAGQHQQAVTVYFATVRADPTNLPALLGLERVLPLLGRLPELLPVAQRAAVAGPKNGPLRALLLRTYVALNELDSARAAALRWAADAPGDEAPWREWAIALEDAHRHDAALEVLLAGRRAIARPPAFGVELADLLQRSGDWEGAAREWVSALTEAPAQLPTAASRLAEAPQERRERVVRELTARDSTPLARRLAAELLLDWGQAQRAWTLFEPTVAAPSPEAASALRRFADIAGARSTPEARHVRALALARYADMVSDALAVRARAEAARAFLAAGDRAAAREMLEHVERDSTAPPDAQALAQRALVDALIDDGRLDEAARRLASDTRLGGDDRAALRLKLARARVLRGELDLADAVLAGDSGVDALAAKGWIALYRGRLKEAQNLFRAAGPYAGDRRDATERSGVLALVQQLPTEDSPELGRALLLLGRGDSARAVDALQHVAGRLGEGTGAGAGAPAVLLLAGRVAARLGSDQQRTALALFEEVVRADGNGGAAAPEAELEWARLLERRQRTAEAVQHLEHLILTYPRSAFVPEARRELERAKGAIPKS